MGKIQRTTIHYLQIDHSLTSDDDYDSSFEDDIRISLHPHSKRTRNKPGLAESKEVRSVILIVRTTMPEIKRLAATIIQETIDILLTTAQKLLVDVSPVKSLHLALNSPTPTQFHPTTWSRFRESYEPQRWSEYNPN
jgi:hypothetical protein